MSNTDNVEIKQMSIEEKQQKIDEILERHRHWRKDCDGCEYMRANIQNCDFSFVNLKGAYLRDAIFLNVDFSGADLSEANLSGACITKCNFTNTNLSHTDLSGAILGKNIFNKTDFRNANLILSSFPLSNFTDTDFTGASLQNCDFDEATFNNTIIDYPLACPEKGSFIGYKQVLAKSKPKEESSIRRKFKELGLPDSDFIGVYNVYIAKLEIPADAKRSSATTNKCRCNKARVLEIQDLNGNKTDIKTARPLFRSTPNFVYTVGEMVAVDDFDDNRWNECSTGIHFFMNREDAVQYNR